MWSYRDKKRDADWSWVDVTRTTLDTRETGKYRVRVFGTLFIKNLTDVLRVYLDTDRSNRGPEYAISWFLGRSPAGHVGQAALSKTTDWEKFGSRKRCHIGKSANYLRDRLTLEVPRSCLGNPDQVRWAGYVGDISRATRSTLYGSWDEFPRLNRFPKLWAGGDQPSGLARFASTSTRASAGSGSKHWKGFAPGT